MNNQRTFGIEIECHSQITKGMMVARLKRFFEDNGINHSAVSQSYMHQTDEDNTTVWYVKDDSSIHAQNSMMRGQYPHDMEIASPVLKGRDGFKALKIVCEALDGIATVSKSCGLHAHHGVKEVQYSGLRRVINAWIKSEKYFYYALPNSRQNNHHCRSWASLNPQPIQENESPITWYNNLTQSINSRKTSLNFRSYTARRTLEFRLHSGTVEFPKIKNWLALTQRWLEFALAGVFELTDSVFTFQEFIEKLNQNGSIEIGLQTAQLSEAHNPYAGKSDAEVYILPGSKKKKWPRPNSKAYTVLEAIKTGKTKSELVILMNETYGEFDGDTFNGDYPKQKKYVSAMLTNIKSTKAGWGFNVVKKRLATSYKKKYKFYLLPLDYNGDPDDCPTVNPDATATMQTQYVTETVDIGALTNEDKAAIGHFVERCVHFQEEQRGQALT